MRAVVTGGAGFIGSHLTDALTERGDEVLVVDDLSTGRSSNLAASLARGAKLITADVAGSPTLATAIEAHQPDCVFHLAAQVDVRISVEQPGHDVRVNVEGTVNALDAARAAGCEQFVFASSCAVYGEPGDGDIPLGIDAPLCPGSPYGQAKLAAEGYAGLYRDLHGMRCASLRFANVYGPRQGAVGEAGVVSIFTRRLMAGKELEVFGSGEQTRDFVYVGDVVSALIGAADAGISGELNVGTGIETTVLELVEMLSSVAGRPDLEPVMSPPRVGEIDRMALDASETRELLDWEPEMDLAEGLALTYESNAPKAAPAAL